MLTTFQKLCVRGEPGVAYDKSSLIELSEGISFSELLCKITSKCDTSLLLLASHKGKLKNFYIKVVGLKLNQTQSVKSAVISSFKKGLSYLNGSGSGNENEKEIDEDTRQVASAWVDCRAEGYHGMQVVALLDKEHLPDNESRKLYDLHLFVAYVLHSMNAYYMFQKPDIAFVCSLDFSAQQLREHFPNADTFAIAVVWQFVNEPTLIAGKIRAVPIVRRSVQSETPFSPSLGFSGSSISKYPRSTFSTSVPNPPTRLFDSGTNSPVSVRQERAAVDMEAFFDAEAPTLTYSPEKSPAKSFASSVVRKKAASPVSIIGSSRTPPRPKNESVHEQIKSPKIVINRLPTIEKLTSDEICESITPKRLTRRCNASQIEAVTSPKVPSLKIREVKTEENVSVETPEMRRVRGVGKRQAATRCPSRRGTKRLRELDEEEADETSAVISPADGNKSMDDEICFKATIDSNLQTIALENSCCKEPQLDSENAQFIHLPVEDSVTVPSKPKSGRKSMTAEARKSLANEWPVEDRAHMLHFFDNLNPKQNETSRVALTCKYALVQYDRDLSSKLLYQWLEVKGRSIQREILDFTLAEDAQKETALELYHKLNTNQSESSRVSFTIKFIQAQYGVAVSSKQLFSWLKEKHKRARR